MLVTLLSFGIPAVLSHFGVSLALPALAGLVGTRAASAVGGKVAGKLAGDLAGRIFEVVNGRLVEVRRNTGEQFTPPKFQPGQGAGPDEWTTLKQ